MADQSDTPKVFRKIISLTLFLYKHPLIRYLFVGGSSFVIYFVVIVFLHEKQSLALSLATTIGYWTSVLWNFSLNRWWTFSVSETKSLHKHIAAYLVLLGINYGFNLLFISMASKYIGYKLAVILAVAIQTSWTYVTYKNVIFKTGAKNPAAKESED